MGCGGKNRVQEQQRSVQLFLLIAFLATIEAHLPYTSVISETEGLRKEQNNWAGEGSWLTGKRTDNTTSNVSGLPSSFFATEQPGNNNNNNNNDNNDNDSNALIGDRRTRGGGRKMFGETYSRQDSIVRHRKLYSRCSSKYLRMYGSRVDSFALPNDIYSELRFETWGADSLVTIQGSSSRNFLCFNRKGRIAVKHSVRSRRCLFHEIYSSDHYTEFHSAANATWWLGFGRKGQRLHGQRWTRSRRQRRCFQFLKIDPNVGSGQADDEEYHGSQLGLVRPHNGRRRSYQGGVQRLRHSLET